MCPPFDAQWEKTPLGKKRKLEEAKLGHLSDDDFITKVGKRKLYAYDK